MKKKKLLRAPSSLAAEINIAYMLSFAVFLFILAGTVFVSFRIFVTNAANSDLRKAKARIVNAADRGSMMNELRILAEDKVLTVNIYENNEIIDSINEYTNKTQIPRTPYNKITGYSYMGNYYRTVTIKSPFDETEIQVVRNMTNERDSFSALSNIIFTAVIFALVVSTIIGFMVSHYLLRPLNAITKSIQSISVNNLSTRIENKKMQSELNELALALNEMLDKIEDGYENQRRFASDVSHELRTPLSVIKGYSDLLQSWGGKDAAVTQEAVLAISQQSGAMLDTVERLLFLTRAQVGSLQLSKTHFNLSELAYDIITDISLLNPTLKITGSFDENIIFYADKALVRQLLVILLDNSAKYTPSDGGINVIITDRGDNTEIIITDTGIGIKKEELERVFDRFYRTDKSRTKGTGGTGIGLTIAKEIVTAHGGGIEAEIIPGKGTKIIVVLPK